MSTAIQDCVLRVVGRVLLRFAKDAGRVSQFVWARVSDVFASPRTPKSFHDSTGPDDYEGSPYGLTVSLMSSFNSLPALK